MFPLLICLFMFLSHVFTVVLFNLIVFINIVAAISQILLSRRYRSLGDISDSTARLQGGSSSQVFKAFTGNERASHPPLSASDELSSRVKTRTKKFRTCRACVLKHTASLTGCELSFSRSVSEVVPAEPP